MESYVVCGALMKIAVGIIALVLSMIVFMQSCTITGLSGLADDTASQEAGTFGMLTAFLMFLGGAFAFGVPRVATALLALAFLASIPAREDFPDMMIWGGVCAVLGLILSFTWDPKKGGDQK